MRLQRVGRRNDPAYRIVVTDSRTGPKSNKHVDLLGSYNPKLNHVQLDGDRAKDWLGKGVQMSDTVHNILVSEKVIEGKKINVLPKKSPIVKEIAESAEETSSEPTEGEAAPGAEEVEAKSEETAEVAAEASTEKAPAEEPAKEESVEETKEETEEEKKD